MTDETQKPTPREMRKTAKKTVRFAKAAIALLDANSDGYLSLEELGRRIPQLSANGIGTYLDGIRTKELKPRIDSALEIQKGFNAANINTNVMTDDTQLINEQALTEALSASLGIGPERMAKLVHHAFPKGVANVKLSDACATMPDLKCTPLPKGKVMLHLTAGPRT